MSIKRYLVTSALPYANGPQHVGHLTGAYLPADVYVRYLRLKILTDGVHQLQIDSPDEASLEFGLFQSGSPVEEKELSVGDATNATYFDLLAGDYVAAISNAMHPDACFTLTLSR